MKHSMFFIAGLVAAALTCTAADSTMVTVDPVVNVGAETYAIGFREMARGMELWCTMATTRSDVGRRSLAVSTSSGAGFVAPVVMQDDVLNAPNASYNGVPHFNPCDRNEMVFVSDRATSSTGRRSNDIYLARQQNGEWTVSRLPINSSAWDDTPTFGPRGEYLYFASDRHAPGSGHADIFIARRQGDTWSEPVAVRGLDVSGRHETSPFVHHNTLYYSSNADGDQDIWSAEIDPATGALASEPRRLSIPGVNSVGSDEYHPVFSPGGTWFYVSSNRGQDKERHFHIYRYQLPAVERTLAIRVTARTVIRDREKRRFFGDLDSISSVRTSVVITDVERGDEQTLQASADGVVELRTSSTDDPAAHPDRAVHTYIVRATPHAPGFVSSIDTLIVNTGSSCALHVEHVLYLDDTTTRKRACEFTFRTFNVPFFVTAYWCPTTRKYRQYTACASLFTDDVECAQLDQPAHCETDEAYAYAFTPAVLTRTARGAENCVSYREFNDSGMVWADQVDHNIEHMRDEVRSALSDACVQTAVANGLPIELRYVGTTDDRAIHPKCQYTGKEYSALKALAPQIEIDTDIVPYITTGRHFNRGGYGGKAGGNQLLSDLRALNFAILFDNLCASTIDEYARLRRMGLLRVHSSGQAIDSRDLPYTYKRAAGVEIRVPGFEERFAGRPIRGGRKIVLCPDEGCK